jgi:hypothetical protein
MYLICGNTSLNPDLLAAALQGLQSGVELTKGGDGPTPPHNDCEILILNNYSLTPELLTAVLEVQPVLEVQHFKEDGGSAGRAELREHFLLTSSDGTLDREEWEQLCVGLQSLLQESSPGSADALVDPLRAPAQEDMPAYMAWFNEATHKEGRSSSNIHRWDELGDDPSVSYDQFLVRPLRKLQLLVISRSILTDYL